MNKRKQKKDMIQHIYGISGRRLACKCGLVVVWWGWIAMESWQSVGGFGFVGVMLRLACC